MREILFRGKNPVSGEWAYGSLVLEKNAFDERLILAIISDADGNETLVNPETVGQYTGLKDKNGKRIFEGDIIRDEDGDIMVVKWQSEGAVFVLEPKPYVSVHFYSTLPSKIEIIGNIHDNPELLEES